MFRAFFVFFCKYIFLFNLNTMTNASSELSMAWDIIENTGANLFLTGKAGTGKTTFLKDVREKSTKRLIVLAPTGIAAINAGGVTIHSFFNYLCHLTFLVLLLVEKSKNIIALAK